MPQIDSDPICKRRALGIAPATTPCLRASKCSKSSSTPTTVTHLRGPSIEAASEASTSHRQGRNAKGKKKHHVASGTTASLDKASSEEGDATASSSSASGSSASSSPAPSVKAGRRGKRTVPPNDHTASTDSTGDTTSESDSSDSIVSDELGRGRPGEQRRQGQYLRQHIHRGLYPDLIHPESDHYFPEADCAALAAVHGKYRQLQWLEMQAGLFNVTGRMVPLGVIRNKCERAEADEAQSPGPSQHEQRGQLAKVEKWVSEVSGTRLAHLIP